MLRAHGGDIKKLAESLMERQKGRPNLVSPASQPSQDQSIAEDKPANPYNTKT
jgi:hypothetical protein